MNNNWNEFICGEYVVIPEKIFEWVERHPLTTRNMILGKVVRLFFVCKNKHKKELLTEKEILMEDLAHLGLIELDENSENGFVFKYDFLPELQLEQQINGPKPHSFVDRRESRKRVFKFMEDSLGRPLSLQEVENIYEWVDEYGVEEDAVIFILDNFYGQGINNVAYINKVVIELHAKQIITVDLVKSYFAQSKNGGSIEEQIANYLSLNRMLTEPEKRLINEWIGSCGHTLEEILRACDKTVVNRRPSLAHVDAILKGRENINNESFKKKNSSAKPKKDKKTFSEYEEFC